MQLLAAAAAAVGNARGMAGGREGGRVSTGMDGWARISSFATLTFKIAEMMPRRVVRLWHLFAEFLST